MNKPRHECIKNYIEIQSPDDAHYKGSDELLSIGAPFGKHFGFERLGIHHELLPPGRRTSYPHAESHEEEFVYVIEGHPDVWINGFLHHLHPGDGVGFKPGTGVCHTFINNSDLDVRLLVVGDTSIKENKVFYPTNPERQAQIGAQWWSDVPQQNFGDHNGLPKTVQK